MPSITIYIADRGTERENREPATVGHMWYSLNNDKGKIQHFSFHQNTKLVPENSSGLKKLITPGEFYFDDGDIYKNPGYSRKIELTQEQYEAVKKFSDDPEAAGFQRNYNAFTNSCIDFVWAALHAAGINPSNFEGDIWPNNNIDDVKEIQPRPTHRAWSLMDGVRLFPSDFFREIGKDIERSAKTTLGITDASAEAAYAAAEAAPIDPLALDLDGDGIETAGTQAGILFDHNDNGIQTGTGWLKPDDGWLVLDRDDNGAIDSGKELFGADTIKANGQRASDGFDALRDFDSNGDDHIDADDKIFADLRVWRDINQDGITQVDEMATLSAHAIKSISLQTVSMESRLGNGNALTATATFSREDGSSGSIANLDLASNTFQRNFLDRISLSEPAMLMPNLPGTGRVRDLAEAISISADLTEIIKLYSTQITRQGQMELLDTLIEKWADTSDLGSLQSQAKSLASEGVSIAYNFPGTDGSFFTHGFLRKLGIVERFMGFTYAGPRGGSRINILTPDDGAIKVTMGRQQIGRIESAYNFLKRDIYESLLPMTRMSNSTALLSRGCFMSDFSALENELLSTMENNAQAALSDLMDFIDAINRTRFAHSGWNSDAFVLQYLRNMRPHDHYLKNTEFKTIHVARQGENNLDGTPQNDILVSTMENNRLSGKDGNDYLLGGNGNDILNGGSGDDILDGGEGDDVLFGGTGDDTYIFGRGSGNDTIDNRGWYDRGCFDVILIDENVLPEDVCLSRKNASLLLRIKDSDDQLDVEAFFSRDGSAQYDAISEIRFGNGSFWSKEAIVTMLNIATDGDDMLYGGLSDAILDGGTGNDHLFGGAGSDIYIFGRGYGMDVISNLKYNYYSYHLPPDFIHFKEDISPDDIILTRNDTDLNLRIRDSEDLLHVDGYFSWDYNAARTPIAKLIFSDGTSWDSDSVIAMAMVGTDGADALYSGAGDDILDGKSGDDVLTGGAGSDTYIFGRGYGNDVILNQQCDVYKSPDIVRLDKHISPEDITLTRQRTSLILGIKDCDDSLDISEYFNHHDVARYDAIAKLCFSDGTYWDKDAIVAKMQVSTDGDDMLYGGAGSDILDGGFGNDFLRGCGGNDTYVFGYGYGNDRIDNYLEEVWDSSARILLSEDVSDNEVVLTREYDDLIISLSKTDDTLEVTNYFIGSCDSSAAVEKICFASGTIWGVSEIQAMVNIPTANNDHMQGYYGIDLLFGGAGDDFLEGNDGDDVLDGGTGNDILWGGDGSDTYHFAIGSGHDTIKDNNGWRDSNKVIFGDDIAESDIWLQREGDDLALHILDTNDKLTVRSWYRGGTYQIDAFHLKNGKQLLANQVDNMVGSMAAILQPGGRLSDLSADQKFTMAAIAGTNWR